MLQSDSSPNLMFPAVSLTTLVVTASLSAKRGPTFFDGAGVFRGPSIAGIQFSMVSH